MATMARPIVTGQEKPSHKNHAEANILNGHWRQPPVKLNDLRGGHFFQRAERYSLEGLISFRSGYSHVSGNRSLKNHGWVTLATSVLEGLNDLDVVTADRMV